MTWAFVCYQSRESDSQRMNREMGVCGGGLLAYTILMSFIGYFLFWASIRKKRKKGGNTRWWLIESNQSIFDFIDLLSSDRTIDLLTGLRIRIELTLSTTSIVPFPFCFLALTFVSNQTNKVLTGRLLTWLIGMSWWKYIFKRHAVWPPCC